MATKEQLIACRDAYCNHGCKLIEITHDDGTKSGIANPDAIRVAMAAIKTELGRQISMV